LLIFGTVRVSLRVAIVNLAEDYPVQRQFIDRSLTLAEDPQALRPGPAIR
jgi:hypothetical protein